MELAAIQNNLSAQKRRLNWAKNDLQRKMDDFELWNVQKTTEKEFWFTIREELADVRNFFCEKKGMKEIEFENNLKKWAARSRNRDRRNKI
jgi:hypothetical protein